MELSRHADRSEPVAQLPQIEESRVALPVCAALIVIQCIGVALGRLVLPPTNGTGGTIASHLLSWDANYYLGIARIGYTWDPALAAHHYQNVAFFPLQAIIDRCAILLAGSSAKPVILVFTLMAGLASIIAFERLANMLLQPRQAALATICFGLWPASSFYLMGYPTGLISLFIILALQDHLAGRFWRSALWLGLGTAAAPTVVFVGAALGVHHLIRWLQAGAPPFGTFRLAGWALLALAGLLGFMLYQWIALGDPFAFTQAQIAWGTAPPPLARLLALLDLRRYLQQPHAGLVELHRATGELRHHVSGQAGFLFAMGLQRFVNFVALVTAFVALVAATVALRGPRAIAAWAGWTVFFGYLWFIVSTAQNVLDAPRLLFPAVALFAGLGVLLARMPVAARWAVIAVLGAVSLGEMAAAAAGYWVV